MDCVPGGTMGVAVKLKLPKMAACADGEGLRREDLTRFKVMVTCAGSRSHSETEKFGSHVHSPTIR